MKVKVTTELKVRHGMPKLSAPSYQLLDIGSQVEVLEETIVGDNYGEDNRWLKDAANNYYPLSKTNYSEQSHLNESTETVNDPLADLFEEINGDGSGVGIAILDSGINPQHSSLQPRIKYYQSFLPSGEKDNISEHGTKVAGIIASAQVGSIRNKSDLYCFRVADQYSSVDNDAVYNALKAINDSSELYENIDLINLSLDVIPDYISPLQNLVNQLLEKNIVCVVAAGEGMQLNNIAALENVIRIGVFNSANQAITFSDRFHFAFQNQPIPTYGLASEKLDNQLAEDSAYCALTTALIARFMSAREISQLSVNSAIEKFTSIASSVSQSSTIIPFKPYQS